MALGNCNNPLSSVTLLILILAAIGILNRASHAAEIVSYPIAYAYEGKPLASKASFAYEIGEGVILLESHDAFFAVPKREAASRMAPSLLFKIDEKTPVFIKCTAAEERKPFAFITHHEGGGDVQFYDPLNKQLSRVALPRDIEPTTLQVVGDLEAITIDSFSGQLHFLSPKIKSAAYVDKKQEANLTHAVTTIADAKGKRLIFGGHTSQLGLLDISDRIKPKVLWVNKYSNENNYPYSPSECAFSDDGNYILFLTYNMHLLLVNGADGSLIDRIELGSLGNFPSFPYFRIVGSMVCVGVNSVADYATPPKVGEAVLQQSKTPVCGVYAVKIENNKLIYLGGKKFDRVLDTATNSKHCYCVLGDQVLRFPHEELYQIVSKKSEPAANR